MTKPELLALLRECVVMMLPIIYFYFLGYFSGLREGKKTREAVR